VACFGPEAVQEARVTGVLLFEDFDGDNAAKDLVLCLPDFTHAANGDTFGELVSAA
jgi:hypothetical protein